MEEVSLWPTFAMQLWAAARRRHQRPGLARELFDMNQFTASLLLVRLWKNRGALGRDRKAIGCGPSLRNAKGPLRR
jgi:hypothetical protein